MEPFSLQSGIQVRYSSTADITFNVNCCNEFDVTVRTPDYSAYNLDCFFFNFFNFCDSSGSFWLLHDELYWHCLSDVLILCGELGKGFCNTSFQVGTLEKNALVLETKCVENMYLNFSHTQTANYH